MPHDVLYDFDADTGDERRPSKAVFVSHQGNHQCIEHEYRSDAPSWKLAIVHPQHDPSREDGMQAEADESHQYTSLSDDTALWPDDAIGVIILEHKRYH